MENNVWKRGIMKSERILTIKVVVGSSNRISKISESTGKCAKPRV